MLLEGTGTLESAPSNEISITCGAGPQAPTGLGAAPAEGGGVSLTWNPSPTPGVTYRVYRGTAASFTPSPASLIADGVVTGAYLDSDAQAQTYYYCVSALSGSGAESPYSNQAGASGAGAPAGTGDRLGVKAFWTYAGLDLARGEAMVNLGSGNLVLRDTDSLVPGNRLVSEVRRTYNSLDKNPGPWVTAGI